MSYAFAKNDRKIMKNKSDNTGVYRIYFSPNLDIKGFDGQITYILDINIDLKELIGKTLN